MRELVGKVAVVTGAASGIGRGMARAFSRAGMRVVIADLELTAAEAVAMELNGLAVAVDVTKPESVDALADKVYAEFGAVHLLCNNAGVAVGGPLSIMTREDWKWLLSVNVEGVANCLTAFLPRMRKQEGEAHIVNTGSALGLLPAPNVGVYSATKAAVVAISEVLRAELAPDNIGVTVVCPGTVRTRIIEADRNRPSALSNTNAPKSQLSDPEGAIDPDKLGLQILDAVIANDLYVITLTEGNKALVPLLKKRFDTIMEKMP